MYVRDYLNSELLQYSANTYCGSYRLSINKDRWWRESNLNLTNEIEFKPYKRKVPLLNLKFKLTFAYSSIIIDLSFKNAKWLILLLANIYVSQNILVFVALELLPGVSIMLT